VMTPRTEVQEWADLLAQAQPPATVWDNDRGLSGWLNNAVDAPVSSATARYLSAALPVSVDIKSFSTIFDAQEGVEMGSMEYGLAESSGLGASLLDASNDLLRSTGQLLKSSSWAIEAQDW